jgi:hypothetical protein
VGVPSQESNQPAGLAGPLSPQEIARRRAARPPADATQVLDSVSVRVRRRRNLNGGDGPDWRPLDAPLVCPPEAVPQEGKPPPKPYVRRRWRMETRWHHCLTYPLRAWPLVVGLAIAQALLTLAAVLLLPRFHADFNPDSLEGWLPLSLGLIPLAILGYTAAFLDLVLESAAAGEHQEVRWPGCNLYLVARGAARWLVCFLAGPAVPGLVGFWFWLSCGEPTFVDRAILAELAVVTIGSWVLTVLAVADAGSLRAAAPPGVVDLFARLGVRAAVPLLAVPVLVFAFARLALTGVEDLHRDSASGVLLLVGAWFGALFVGTFLCRLMGLWCFRTRHPTPAGAPSP